MKARTIFTTTYETSDKSLKFDVVVKQGTPLKFNCYGKSWAKRTEVSIYMNDFILANNFTTKHANDKDDLKYAVVNTLRPIMKNINIEWIRKEIWTEVFKSIESYQSKNKKS